MPFIHHSTKQEYIKLLLPTSNIQTNAVMYIAIYYGNLSGTYYSEENVCLSICMVYLCTQSEHPLNVIDIQHEHD